MKSDKKIDKFGYNAIKKQQEELFKLLVVESYKL
jgi:hypothetical protein